MEKWKYSSTILGLGTKMSFMPLPLYSLGEKAPIPIGHDAGWASKRYRRLEKRKILKCWESTGFINRIVMQYDLAVVEHAARLGIR
jgi:hypothetical protein